MEHPIPKLMIDAEDKFGPCFRSRVVASQQQLRSTTKIPPGPTEGFDEWWKFVKKIM